MFIGQMGISNTLNQVKSKQIKHQKQYVEDLENLAVTVTQSFFDLMIFFKKIKPNFTNGRDRVLL